MFLNSVKINGNRRVSGVLRGFDPFMNVVLDNAIEFSKTGKEIPIGMIVIRGNSINIIEALERI